MISSLTALATVFSTTYALNLVTTPPDQLYLLPSAPSPDSLGATNTTAPYTSYDTEFEQLIQGNPVLVVNGSDSFAYEAGAWDPYRNEVWFTSLLELPPNLSYPSVLRLTDSTVYRPHLIDATGAPVQLVNPNGGYYFNGSIYFAIAGSNQTEGGVTAVDTNTDVATTVINSYFGLPLTTVDDVVWTLPANTSGFEQSFTCSHVPHLFFSTLDTTFLGFNLTQPALPNAYYRFTPSTQSLVAVIPRAEVLNPNGIATDKSFRYLYVTDYSITPMVGAGELSSGSSAIYRYDLGADCWPQNPRMLALVADGGADGIKVDDAGRIWTAEGRGIVVRNAAGKTLGIFNTGFFVDPTSPTSSVAQFALAGDVLVVLSINRIYTVQLAEIVVSPDRYSRTI